ncbi:MAG: regulatory protein RecX [Gammaproteobacteria bacterium]|nr:regulatory protein RecX [Gammaproteobacteria bacterium]
MRLLAMREHSRSELETKLSKKTESKDLLFAVLDELRKENYQSDSRFAESFVRSRANRGMGPIKIRSELKNRGVDSAIIDEYLDASAGKWFDRAAAVYQRKYGDSPILQYSDWSKRARFLQSRGFTSEQINDALPARN